VNPDAVGARLEGDTRAALAVACRRIIAELASSTADTDDFADALDHVMAAVRGLESRTHGRPYEEAEASLADYGDDSFLLHSPLVGPLNPLAPPLELSIDDGVVTGVARFGDAYEGPPGCVHGGFIAAAFDEVLGFAQGLSGQPGMTARLTVNYRSPSPLHEELRFTGRVDRVDGRKIYTLGEMRVPDGRLCAEAEGLFISMKPEVFMRLVADRERD